MTPEDRIREVIETLHDALNGVFVLGSDDYAVMIESLEEALYELES